MSLLQPNARIENFNGLKFYEQDIAMLSYVFYQDIIIEFEATYNNPGIGIVLIKESKYQQDVIAYLLKNSIYDFSVYNITAGLQKDLILQTSTLAPNGSDIKFRFYKNGINLNFVYMQNNEEKSIGKYTLPEFINSYKIGIYSNANNIFKNITLFECVPSEWTTNLKNTNEGRIFFYNNSISIIDAENDIEAEFQKIYVPKGLHYLSYDKEAINNKLDLDVYLYPSEMDNLQIKAKEKNILQQDKNHKINTQFFELKEDKNLTLLIQSSSGKISNLTIKDDYRQDYVATDNESKKQNGSQIILQPQYFSKIEWEGVINDIPKNKLNEVSQYSIYTYANTPHTLESLYLQQEKKYRFVIEFDHENAICFQKIYDNEKLVFEAETMMDNSDLVLFYNVKGIIYSLILTDRDNRKWDIMLQKTIKKYIPAGFNGPILVTNVNGEPLDISSSYRRLSNGQYIFTVWNREVFEAANKISLECSVSNKLNIIVYALKEDYDKNKIYDIEDLYSINNIDLAVKNYDKISGDFYELEENNTLIFDKSIYHDYKYFIIDYLKDNSYAINLNQATNTYEVDISTTEEIIKTYYDIDNNNNVVEYKPIDITPQDNQYIVLTRDVVSQ